MKVTGWTLDQYKQALQNMIHNGENYQVEQDGKLYVAKYLVTLDTFVIDVYAEHTDIPVDTQVYTPMNEDYFGQKMIGGMMGLLKRGKHWV